ncbi:MAG: alpha/beta hydrolase [Pirellulales bacterium]
MRQSIVSRCVRSGSVLALLLFTCQGVVRAENLIEPLRLWPAAAPGDTKTLPAESDLTKPDENQVAGKRVIRLGNVSDPTLTVFRPAKEIDTGAAVVVCPGGGFHILAWDLEGTEVCEWLNSIGVTGVLLKYRVPVREGRARHEAPLQDAQRALGLVRHHATEWGIDPKRIGVLGFSAGGHLAASLCTNFEQRTYDRVDAADDVSCRPDFAILIYPAYLIDAKADNQIVPHLKITEQTPPTFLTMAQDDPVNADNVLYWALALKQAKVPVGVHLYPTGGHGYGLRRTESPSTTWPDRAAEWLRERGMISTAK